MWRWPGGRAATKSAKAIRRRVGGPTQHPTSGTAGAQSPRDWSGPPAKLEHITDDRDPLAGQALRRGGLQARTDAPGETDRAIPGFGCCASQSPPLSTANALPLAIKLGRARFSEKPGAAAGGAPQHNQLHRHVGAGPVSSRLSPLERNWEAGREKLDIRPRKPPGASSKLLRVRVLGSKERAGDKLCPAGPASGGTTGRARDRKRWGQLQHAWCNRPGKRAARSRNVPVTS